MPDVVLGFLYTLFWIAVFIGIGLLFAGWGAWRDAGFPMPWGRHQQVAVQNGNGRHLVPVVPRQEQSTPAVVPQFVDIHTVAKADNILIVGNKDSGKTTLLQALIRVRQGVHCVFDPHNAPNKWPDGSRVTGGGLDYDGIAGGLQSEFQRMQTRASEMNRHGKRDWPAVTLVADEWRAITQELDGKQGRFNAADVLLKILTQGRKFDMRFLAASHNDTTASLGVAGDKEVVFSSFDWVIYMGAFVRKKLSHEVWETIPTTTTPDGKLLPLMVVAYNPVEEQSYLLDVRNLPQSRNVPKNDHDNRVLLDELHRQWEPGDTVTPPPSQKTLTPRHLRVLQLLMTDPTISIRAVARDLWPQSGDGGSGYSEMAKEIMRDVVEMTGVKSEALAKIDGVKQLSNGVKQT